MAKIPMCESSKKKIANCPSPSVQANALQQMGFVFPLNRLSSRDFPSTVPRPEAGETSRDGASLDLRWRNMVTETEDHHGIHGHLGIVMILFELRVQSYQKNGVSMVFFFFYPICLPIWWVFFPSKLQKSPEVQIHGIVWSLNPERKNCCHRLWKMRWSFWACRGGLR